jgi:hypothetical protein
MIHTTNHRTNWGEIMRKQAQEEIKKHLEAEQVKVRSELIQGKYAMKKLIEKQTLLKRQLAVYQKLIGSLECNKP